MRATTHSDPKNSTTNIENIYTDIDFPWIKYHGTRPKTNPNGPRSIWYIFDEREKNKKTGPFGTLKMAKAYIHGELHIELPTANGNKPEPETQKIETQLTIADILREPEPETITDQLIEFSCPHCGKGILGLLARK